MDLIYIIEEGKKNKSLIELEEIISIQDSLKNNPLKKNGAAYIAGAAALGILTASAPVSLLIGASSAAPIIYKKLSSNENPSKDEIKELNKFINDHSITKNEAIARGLKFQPGHPRVGETYKLHPLANHQNSSKENLYIPEHIFDEVLFEEREAELLTLLIHLGATEIEISKYTESLINNDKSGGISCADETKGKIETSGSINRENENNERNIRKFSLKGKPWNPDSKINREEFAWLKFEPSWNAVVTAREIGGCTSATLEIKESSKYAENKEASIGLKVQIYSATGITKLMEKHLTETTYIVRATFA